MAAYSADVQRMTAQSSPAYSSLRNKRLEDTVGNEMRPWRDALSAYLNNLPEMEG